MKFFRKLVIENFQSHAYTEIEFIPRLNVFVGPSDSGKSAILRALRWVLFNQPRGADYVRSGAKQCRVRLILDDGTEIVRVRGKTINRYILQKPDGTEEVYESLGQGAHPMIIEAHQMIPLSWDRDQKEKVIQLGTQLEGPFLLSESGGSKAKMIGRMSGAHIIDQAFKETTRERNQVVGELKRIEKRKAINDEKLEPYQNVPELEQKLQKAIRRYEHAQKQKERLAKCKELYHQIRLVRTEKEKQQTILDRLHVLPQLEDRYAISERQLLDVRRMNQMADQWGRLQKEVHRYQAQLIATEDLPEVDRMVLHMDVQRERLMSQRHQQVRWNRNQKEQIDMQKQMLSLQALPTAMQIVKRLEKKQTRVQQLKQMDRSWKRLQLALGKDRQMIDFTQAIADWIQKRLPTCEQQLHTYHRLSDLLVKRQDNHQRLSVGHKYLRNEEQKIARYSQQYMKLLEQMGQCPTCGSKVNASLLDHLLEELNGGDLFAAATTGRSDEGD